MNDQSRLTLLLRAWQDNPTDSQVASRLAEAVYSELRRIARARLHRESLQPFEPTELVHEVWLRIKPPDTAFDSRENFYKLASTVMRNLLVDQARERLSNKRGGDRCRVTLANFGDEQAFSDVRMLDLDRALDKLAIDHPRAAAVVEMRCFGGLTLREIADELDVGLATVKRDWAYARAWLIVELKEKHDGTE
jgi:RNA polymerase sigma factor (TIGR02999 family)